ncbi:MAG: hypothetical protein KDF65_01960 [Anaerolineae bacterium]|nr:hypothetical protein [Anaerolineae bacterium]
MLNKKTIGFDRELNLSWLDLTAGLLQETSDGSSIRQTLTSRLTDEIPGKEACRKTVTLLTRIWVRVPPEYQMLQSEALTLLPLVLPKERLWLHWGMSMLAYPFFYDVAATVGRLLKLQTEFTSTQVQRRMREAWGERTTVERAVSRLLKTLAAWQVITEATAESHTYLLSTPRHTTNEKLVLWFMECLMWSSRQANERQDLQLPLFELIQSPAMFPFELTPHLATLRRSSRFEISHQGLDLEMVAPH